MVRFWAVATLGVLLRALLELCRHSFVADCVQTQTKKGSQQQPLCEQLNCLNQPTQPLPSLLADCWHTQTRAADSNLQADPLKFPSGMRALSDAIHAKGLKFGIYSDAGMFTCAGYPGSR